MLEKDKVINSLKNLQGVVENLAQHASSVPEVVRGEIEIITSRLSALQNRPSLLKTKEFQYPKGEQADIPKAGTDTSEVFERIIDERDFLPIWFLEQGVKVQRSVARVVLTKPHRGLLPGDGWATGFMVSETLFMTNNHVIPDLDFAEKIRMQFNYQRGADGIEQITESFFPVFDDVFRTNPALDYTLIRLRPTQPTNTSEEPIIPGKRWGFIPLNDSPSFREEQHFNIIQHPDGRLKEVTLQDNEIDKLFANVVLYKGDTEPGSSGSPVFDNVWQLVALHNAGGERDDTGKWINNQGIRIDKIVEDLREHYQEQPEILGELGI